MLVSESDVSGETVPETTFCCAVAQHLKTLYYKIYSIPKFTGIFSNNNTNELLKVVEQNYSYFTVTGNAVEATMPAHHINNIVTDSEIHMLKFRLLLNQTLI